MESATPELTALMCDGMGWFRPVDYKRALLLYDRIHYLLPQRLVEFEDLHGGMRGLVYSEDVAASPLYEAVHFEPDPELQRVLLEAARTDAADPAFARASATIPQSDTDYAWRVVNADGGLGGGSSLGLGPSERGIAQALLLNKFLLAADVLGHAPISGQSYMHGLVAAKYPSCGALGDRALGSSRVPLRADVASRYHPVAVELSSTFISDEDLDARTGEEILEYKERNRPLFRQFTSEMLQVAASISELPGEREFDASVRHILQTSVWGKRAAIQAEFQSAWQSLFKTVTRAGVAGVIGLGVAPLVPLGALVAGAAAAVGKWAIPDLLDIVFRFRKARSHGLYYLMGFSSGGAV